MIGIDLPDLLMLGTGKYTPGRPMTEEDVIDFLTGNFIELALEGYVDEERLRSNAGFLIGWLGVQAHIQVLPLSAGLVKKQ
jgi:hypothetical protein